MSSRRSPTRSDRLVAVARTALILAVSLAWLSGPSAGLAGEEAAFDREVRKLAAHCFRSPATNCAARAFALADRDGDGLVDAGELDALNQRLRVWTQAHGDELHPMDLRAMRLGFLLVDAIGIERGIMFYDDDGDGALSLEEATADLLLDERPLPKLVQQRELVDWSSLRRRFGATAMLFDYFDIR